MAKRIEMTRARQQALPVVVEAARNYLAMMCDEAPARSARTEQRLREALEAFK